VVTNCIEHGADVLEHVSIGEAKHANSVLRKKIRAASIEIPLFRFEVTSAIDLDHQSGHWAVEVHDVRRQGVLAAELEAIESPSSEIRPENYFGTRGVPPQTSLRYRICHACVVGAWRRKLRREDGCRQLP